MNEKSMVGYHATARENVDKILTNGFEKSSLEKHWLGKGVYFYSDLYYAVEWEIIGVLRKDTASFKEIEDNCAILSSNINCENFEVLDISSPMGYSIFLQILEEIKNNFSEIRYKNIKNNGNAEIIRIIEKLEEKQGIKYLSCYDVICAIYPKNIFKKENKSNSDFLVGVQKQICVKNTESISDTMDISINNQEIKNIYDVIIINREKKNDK